MYVLMSKLYFLHKIFRNSRHVSIYLDYLQGVT
jgi:hypothetical protein